MKTYYKCGKWALYLATAILMVAISVSVQAAAINFTLVKDVTYSHGSVAVDPVTGKFYERQGFRGDGTTVTIYNNEAAFVAGSSSGTISLDGGGFYGTYFAVLNGKIYGRTNSSGTETARWDATTGTREQTRPSIPDMGGNNWNHTFDWGGFSGVNWMNDTTGLYVFGRNDLGTDWQINLMNPANISSINSTTTYSPIGDAQLGFGFIINGKLLTGPGYNSNIVDTEVDITTGTPTAVTHTLEGLSTGFYLSQFFYDYSTDVLYAFNTDDTNIYKAANASEQFDVHVSTYTVEPVPTMSVWGLGILITLMGIIGFNRRSRV